MPKSKSKGSRKGSRKGSIQQYKGPPVGAVSYTGPTTLSARPKGDDLTLVRLVYTTPVASTGGGSVSIGYPNNPSPTTEYSAYASLYQEWRCVAMKLRYVPFAHNFVLSTAVGPAGAPAVWSVTRNASLLPPSNLQAAFQLETAKLGNTDTKATIVVRAATAQEMLFQNTTSPGSTWNINMNVDTTSASYTLGTIFIEMLVQFRTRQ